MKNRKKIVVALLLVCALCLGIGYAALTDNLYVDGTVSVSPFAYNVYFASATSNPASGVTVNIGNEADAEDPQGHDDKLTIAVDNTVLNVIGDKVTVSAVIKNDNTDYKAQVILNDTVSAKSGLYKVTCTWADGDGTIAVSGQNTVKIEIELLSVPTESVVDDAFTITFSVTAV